MAKKFKYGRRDHEHQCHCVHMEFRFEFLEDKIEALQSLVKKNGKAMLDEIKETKETLMATIQDVQDAVTAVAATAEAVQGGVTALQASVEALIAKGTVDTTPIVTALGTLNTALSGVNDALVTLKASVDAAVAA